MKIKKILWLIPALFLGVVIFLQYPKLNIISGYASKNMASTVFITGRSPESVLQHDNNMPLISLAKVENNGLSTTASIYGLMKRKTVCHEGIGCMLVNDTYQPSSTFPVPHRQHSENPCSFPYGDKEQTDTIFANIDYDALESAVETAFIQPEIQKTRTVLVAYKNHIVAERYTEGFTKDTPILGWSMTKSILATLYGILEYQDKLDLNMAAPVPAWEDDVRKKITLNHLLRMQSGLEWDEDYTSISDVTQMLFLASDMPAVQAEKQSIAPPTEIWNYSSGTSNLLSGLLRKRFGSLQEYLDFPYSALIDKIGMNSMIIETDMKGNFVASSYAWATTRDWAKFGLLYLNKGKWNGSQLFDETWVDYITTPTEGSNGTYGAHFWLNAGGKYPDVPKDMYSANGFQGQRVFILPSKDIVVVRTGLAEEPEFDINSFLAGIIASID
ncbi:serine hydrolase domain-containing protein [Pareuzebyella sediminis]|uniref:serine hydrolase domain-containing protein n=1 Tax=Pareuzebyella sediminis TaxID=2607998 RepID=UPI0011F08871|nr:serine hydrolase [Pareuzebyella sediminis]